MTHHHTIPKRDIPLQKIESDAISGVGYDRAKRILRIRFATNQTYDYADVPAGLHEALLKAESAGTYFRRNLLGKFKHTKV